MSTNKCEHGEPSATWCVWCKDNRAQQHIAQLDAENARMRDEVAKLEKATYGKYAEEIARLLDHYRPEVASLKAQLARAVASLEAIAKPGHTFTREQLVEEARQAMAFLRTTEGGK